MARLTGKLGVWDVPHAHMWKDRRQEFATHALPIIGRETRIATIGSCFAAELANAMSRCNLRGAMHPAGLFYTSRSIRQEMERIFDDEDPAAREPYWKVKGGFVHPFGHSQTFPTIAELETWSAQLNRRSDELFKNADVVVVTLGLIESWLSPVSGKHYLSIPHPDVFPTLGARFCRLTVSDIREDLETIYRLLRERTTARLVVTVSPVPLHATLTQSDVRIANTESKARIRAAVSEFIEAHDDVCYFHSYEIVATAEVVSDFMLEDGRHVHRHAVDYIVRCFLQLFSDGSISLPETDTTWLTPPLKTAERPSSQLSPAARLKAAVRGALK